MYTYTLYTCTQKSWYNLLYMYIHVYISTVNCTTNVDLLPVCSSHKRDSHVFIHVRVYSYMYMYMYITQQHVHVYNATTNTNYTSQTTVAQWVSNKIKIKHSFGAPFGLRQDIITTIHVHTCTPTETTLVVCSASTLHWLAGFHT